MLKAPSWALISIADSAVRLIVDNPHLALWRPDAAQWAVRPLWDRGQAIISVDGAVRIVVTYQPWLQCGRIPLNTVLRLMSVRLPIGLPTHASAPCVAVGSGDPGWADEVLSPTQKAGQYCGLVAASHLPWMASGPEDALLVESSSRAGGSVDLDIPPGAIALAHFADAGARRGSLIGMVHAWQQRGPALRSWHQLIQLAQSFLDLPPTQANQGRILDACDLLIAMCDPASADVLIAQANDPREGRDATWARVLDQRRRDSDALHASIDPSTVRGAAPAQPAADAEEEPTQTVGSGFNYYG